MPDVLVNLGGSFFYRFNTTGSVADLTSAIEHWQKAVDLTPEGHPGKPLRICNLGVSLAKRFEQSGDLADISTAIQLGEEAVNITPEGHPDTPARISNLASALLKRFRRTNDIADISSAIKHEQKAITLTPGDHPDMPSLMNSLGNALAIRFDRAGDYADLSSAIEHHRKAVLLTPEGHSEMPLYVNGLGNSLSRKFSRMGNIADISSAIQHHQKAVELTPKGHPDLPFRMSSLGNSYSYRFEQTGNITDLSNAIEHYQKAIKLTPQGHAYLSPQISGLANAFRARFEKWGNSADISKAIEYDQKAVQLLPESHPDLPLRLANLAGSLLRRFEFSGHISDNSVAIENYQKAIRLASKGSAIRASLILGLGASFFIRFEKTSNLGDISSAIDYMQQGVDLTPEDDVYMPGYRSNLGRSLMGRFDISREVEDCQRAAFNFKCAATQALGSPTRRLRAAHGWARSCRNLNNPIDTLCAYHTLIQLIPVVANLDQTIQARHSNLTDMARRTAEAAAFAFVVGDVNAALEWLEQGRCLIWAQLHQLRTPVNLLQQSNAHLADRFLAVSRALENSGSRTEPRWSPDSTIAHQITIEGQVRSHLNLAEEWDAIIVEIRALPAFSNFLRPPKAIDILSELPSDGPVIIINVHTDRSDALALLHHADEPLHIVLNSFDYKKAELLRNQLGLHLTSEKLRMRDDRAGRIARRPIHSLGHILRDLWNSVVWPILQGLGYSSLPAHRNRIWWCATGPLSFLPIHAAGIYDPDSKTQAPGKCLFDYAVSSYIPTVTTLLEKLKNADNLKYRNTKVLLLSQPDALPHSSIPGTRKETQTILKRMKEGEIDALLLEDEVGTKSRMTLEMGSHSWAHIASHASQHSTEPLKSGFYLHDGQLELLEIMRQRLPSAELAYLSACQTSVGDDKLSEEAVHLAAGMLAAGYQGVVATMWSINDSHAPQVADDFYGHLLQVKKENGANRLDSRRAAYALDEAMRKIRAKLGDTEAGLLTWVPYIHLGL
ncbi:CHAT domain-containing protein [Crepidotus variabilis]|uniref:CHAT domain-containing protein n=1 Tax=Crepidotus variabilis TaxID=179855 RepID=A0A9P6EJR7_9AGAR|nr:CHAT domain-containing protein [Crepidotus variabilis]